MMNIKRNKIVSRKSNCSLVNIIQINENRAFLAATELSRNLENKENYIVLITEPYVRFNKLAVTPNKTTKIITSGGQW